MARIEIDYTKLCPHLLTNPVTLKPLVVNLETNLEEDFRCDVGENMLDAEVISDLMLKPQNVEVKVSCKGCRFQRGGFARKVEVRVIK